MGKRSISRNARLLRKAPGLRIRMGTDRRAVRYLEDGTHMEQILNPQSGRIVNINTHPTKRRDSCLACQRRFLMARLARKGVKNVGSNCGSSDCSLVAWVLRVSLFRWRDSRPVGNRHGDARPAFLER